MLFGQLVLNELTELDELTELIEISDVGEAFRNPHTENRIRAVGLPASAEHRTASSRLVRVTTMTTRASSVSGTNPINVSMASALRELKRRGPTRRYFRLLRAAVATGDILALSHMGEWLLEGRRDRAGVVLVRAPKRAVNYLRRAAFWAEPAALRALGDCYADGIGTRRDLAAAERCYREGSRRGDHAAAFNLAVLYRDRTDRKKERYWLRRAQRLGNPLAGLVLAEMNLVT